MDGQIEVNNQLFKVNEKEYLGAVFTIILPIQ